MFRDRELTQQKTPKISLPADFRCFSHYEVTAVLISTKMIKQNQLKQK